MKFLVLLLLLSNIVSTQETKVYYSIKKAQSQPKKVHHLNLSKQKLKEFPLEVINFPNLKTLDLSKNNISLIPAEIGELTNLEVLDLSRNKFSILPPQIGNLKNLQVLKLERNKIDHLPEEIIQLVKLKNLNLWKNSVREFPPGMQNLKSLEKIDLRGTIVPDPELKKLKKSLPNTAILFTNGCYCGDGVLKE